MAESSSNSSSDSLTEQELQLLKKLSKKYEQKESKEKKAEEKTKKRKVETGTSQKQGAKILDKGADLSSSTLALMERWMDSTHTFHLSFNKMTITPIDFAAITGLSFGGRSMVFDDGMRTLDRPSLQASLQTTIGTEPTISDQRLRYESIYTNYQAMPRKQIDRYPWRDATDFLDFVKVVVVYQHRRLLLLGLFYNMYYLEERVSIDDYNKYLLLSGIGGCGSLRLMLIVKHMARRHMLFPLIWLRPLFGWESMSGTPACLTIAVTYSPNRVARQYDHHQAIPDYTRFEGSLITQ
ncbi:hypothetical protein JCGZ_13560 [Jatropha curcas]|uniref:Aminotransferase-like plant mobile domain-containing protein n=1 Tax=Jatropha curcas TaxID=180498 RepID=A0A067KDM0_JATCU|nr:hypothetical protein JCGZ_13560 [Jatropha curcas]